MDPRFDSLPLDGKFTKNGIAYPRQKIPAFIAISANGTVNLVFKKVLEDRWKAITIKLSNVGGQLCHCDLIFIPKTVPNAINKLNRVSKPEVCFAYLALAGTSLPNRVAIHELHFGFGGPSK
jgi:hypothetical protein